MAPSLDGAIFFVQGQDDKESKGQESACQFQSLGAGRAELGKGREFEKLRLTVSSCSTRGKVLVPKVRSGRLAGLIGAQDARL